MKLKLFEQSALMIQTESGVRVVVDFGHEVPANTVLNCGAVSATFVSHKHPDHLHAPHLSAIGAPVYAPRDVIVHLKSLGLDLRSIQAGSNVQIGDLSALIFNVDHGPNISEPIDNVGIGFASRHRRVLFLGDMAIPSEIPTGQWDAILIPVGGSKVFSPEEAAHYVHDIGHKGVVIPVHYHGSADHASGEKFRILAADFSDVRVLNVGDEVEL